MKNRNSGFTSIECVISLSILCIIVYIVSVSLYNNYYILSNNISKTEMDNLAKSILHYTKDDIRKKGIITDYIDTETINGYKVERIIEKDKNYYKCYKVTIEIKKNEIIRKLESYVLQQ
ncbi:hypothetical protein [Romboutsia sp. 13368]|uniref:hypothetical protein n=1 Tax=Romboutsia sp. 13368 TaxID=2708053 RepID=UPI0025D95427|nr:hypothetical protein [Romboutsia sp. 13368]